MAAIDPVCLFHGLRRSEHLCLYCCLCFKNLTPEECTLLPDGKREDVCWDCTVEEAIILNHMSKEEREERMVVYG